MKKTLLLSALVVSAASFADTKGFVRGYANSETNIKLLSIQADPKSTLKYGSEFEVEVKDSGFSFGGTLENKTQPISEFTNNLIGGYFESEASNLWAKYDLPEYKGIKSYVKGKLSAKDKDNKIFTLNLEGNVEKDMNGVTVGFNSNTDFTFKTPYTTTTTNKLYAKTDLEKVKDLKGELEVQHTYTLPTTLALKYVNGNISGKYNGIKDTELSAELNARYNHGGTPLANPVAAAKYDINKFLNDELSKKGMLAVDARLDATNTKIENVKLSGTARVIYNYSSLVTPYLAFGVEYTGVKNLTLGAKAEGSKVFVIGGANSGILAHFNLNGKYDYKATNKLTITPELNLDSAHLFGSEHKFKVSPKVSAEYKANDSLTIKGNIGTGSEFKLGAGYQGTTLKAGVDVKYTWE